MEWASKCCPQLHVSVGNLASGIPHELSGSMHDSPFFTAAGTLGSFLDQKYTYAPSVLDLLSTYHPPAALLNPGPNELGFVKLFPQPWLPLIAALQSKEVGVLHLKSIVSVRRMCCFKDLLTRSGCEFGALYNQRLYAVTPSYLFPYSHLQMGNLSIKHHVPIICRRKQPSIISISPPFGHCPEVTVQNAGHVAQPVGICETSSTITASV